MPKLLKPGDIVIYAAVVIAAAASFALTALPGAGAAAEAKIYAGGNCIGSLPLGGEAGMFTIADPPMVIECDGKSVRVTSSPCKNGLCVGMGGISRPGQIIVCVPNGVYIKVEGTPEYDAFAG